MVAAFVSNTCLCQDVRVWGCRGVFRYTSWVLGARGESSVAGCPGVRLKGVVNGSGAWRPGLFWGWVSDVLKP